MVGRSGGEVFRPPNEKRCMIDQSLHFFFPHQTKKNPEKDNIGFLELQKL